MFNLQVLKYKKIGCCHDENTLTFKDVLFFQNLPEVYMLLVAAATENEIRPLKQFLSDSEHFEVLITGMGPVAAAANLSNYLALHRSNIHGVINIGLGGAYVGSGLNLLDICLAQQEVFGDFGISLHDEILDFEPGLSQLSSPLLFNNELVSDIKNILRAQDVEFNVANFVTVNSCSGTNKRGEYLRGKFAAGCENMEGAAVVMVCNTFEIPCIELRCISNLVEDRNTANWMLEDAIDEMCCVAEAVLDEYRSLVINKV
jgi:futalosine hydrolase